MNRGSDPLKERSLAHKGLLERDEFQRIAETVLGRKAAVTG
jgi:hypothetical protein